MSKGTNLDLVIGDVRGSWVGGAGRSSRSPKSWDNIRPLKGPPAPVDEKEDGEEEDGGREPESCHRDP